MSFSVITLTGLLSVCVLCVPLPIGPFPIGPLFTTQAPPPGLPDIKDILGDPLKFSYDDQVAYLKNYHYMGEESPDPKMRNLTKTNLTEAFSKAVKKFQKFAGLTPTGETDNETIIQMMWPRCGVPDKIMSNNTHRRQKRFTVHYGLGWNRTNLSYKIVNTPKNPLIIGFHNGSVLAPQAKPKDIKAAIMEAFKAWSQVSKLRFRKVKRKPDIKLRFVPFDGANKAIAHAYFPKFGGDTFFDNTEVWGVDEFGKYGYNMFQVTVHEIGHALGLGHTSREKAVMYPFYQFKTKWKFHQDDIDGIKWLYPKRNRVRP